MRDALCPVCSGNIPSADLSDPLLECAHCGAKLRISRLFAIGVSFGSVGLTSFVLHTLGLRNLPLLIVTLVGFIPVLIGLYWVLGRVVRLPLQLTDNVTLDLRNKDREP